MAKKRLGIDALFQTSVPAAEPAAADPAAGDTRAVEIDRLAPSAHQPRANFDEAALAELTDSVREHGILQPILVRPSGDDRYEIVAGERRWRAARAAGLERVPVHVVDLDDAAVLAVAMVENLQREDLNPIEEAEGYLELLRIRLENDPGFARFADTDEPRVGVIRMLRAMNNRAAGNTKDNVVLSLESAVAEVFGRVGRVAWTSFVSHRLPLLTLPDDVRAAVRTSGLPYTKARLIARITAARFDGDEANARRIRRDLIDQAVTEGLSVRGLRDEVDRLLARPSNASRRGVLDLGARIAVARDRLETLDPSTLSQARRARVEQAVDALLTVLE